MTTQQKQTQQVEQFPVADAIVRNLRSLARHQTEAAESFVTEPKLWLEAVLTPAQRCGAFNLAMSAYGVGLVMPTDSSGNKVWDQVTYDRGAEMVQGRKLTQQNWVSQKYAPIVFPGRDKRRSFYETITSLALRGRLKGVDPKQFQHADPKETAKLVKEWLIATVRAACGTKEKPGIIAQSRNFRLAVRADLGPITASRKGGATVTDETLLSELE